MRDQNGQKDPNITKKIVAITVTAVPVAIVVQVAQLAAMVVIGEAAVAHTAMMIRISVHGIKHIGKIYVFCALIASGGNFIHEAFGESLKIRSFFCEL